MLVTGVDCAFGKVKYTLRGVRKPKHIITITLLEEDDRTPLKRGQYILYEARQPNET